MKKLAARAVVMAATVIAGLALSISPASADDYDNGDDLHLGIANKNCGYATCSYYVTRESTKMLDDYFSRNGLGVNSTTAVVCGALGYVTWGVGGAYCEITTIVVQEQTNRAANDHGPKGACLKLTVTNGHGVGPEVPTYWSTNNGKYCHDFS
jgi:hypothetical protein